MTGEDWTGIVEENYVNRRPNGRIVTLESVVVQISKEEWTMVKLNYNFYLLSSPGNKKEEKKKNPTGRKTMSAQVVLVLIDIAATLF